MPKGKCSMSVDEFACLPIVFGADDYSRVYGCNARYATDHAEKLGATRHAGRWVWSKAKVARDLGLDLGTAVVSVDA